jgi:hypothetical protein
MDGAAHDEGRPTGLTRRGFGAAALGCAAAAAALPGTVSAATAGSVRAVGQSGPVIGFHGDAPWVDPTGRDKPYLPPTATGRFAPDTVSLACLGHFL